jgi:phospholipid/cholesterol/gamma-HCH transport system ATP-binding protein
VSEVVIALQGIDKAFDGNVVLAGLDLEIRRGETFTILGGSGSGKSVTLKLMIGLLRPERGRVLVQGRDVTDLPERDWVPVRRAFGMVFQGAALFDSLTVLENVAYPLREHTDMGEEAIRQRVAERLGWVGLEGVEEQLPAQLSGGMRKRVAVARAVALDPEIILYDEPTTGLDPANSRRIGELISSLQRRLGVTSVVVTHELALCFAVSDRIGLLDHGRLVQEGPPDEMRREPGPEAREFFAGSQAAAP